LPQQKVGVNKKVRKKLDYLLETVVEDNIATREVTKTTDMKKSSSNAHPKSVYWDRRQQPYRIYQPLHTLAIAVASSALLSYFIGRAARLFIELPTVSVETYSNDKIFEASSTCNFSLSEDWESKEQTLGDASQRQDEGNQGLPVGSHLLLDFKGIDSDFLRSEDQMKQALLAIIQQHEAFDLQYIYSMHTDLGNVVVGGLSDAKHHAWIYGWPKQGVILLDLFTSDESDDFLELVPFVESYFDTKIARHIGSGRSFRWSQKTRARGLQDALGDAAENAMTDLHWFPIGTMIDYKQQVRM
jgi:S-adenosylmethionine/arginine decarboxylase-like enzyme